MPGYVIHLCIAYEYLRKHKSKNEDYNDFIDGVIYPDGVSDKSLTHYGPKSSKSNLFEFLSHEKADNSFGRGYFLHLFTDYMFYNRYIDTMTNDMYNDYDILNNMLIKKYNIVLPDKVKNRVFFKDDGTLKILSKELVVKFIDEVSDYDLDILANEVLKEPNKWTKMRQLKHTL